MTKILNNALVKSCGECDKYIDSKSPRCQYGDKIDDCNAINKDCPLQDVGVMRPTKDSIIIIDDDKYKYFDNIDHIIIIVKRKPENNTVVIDEDETYPEVKGEIKI